VGGIYPGALSPHAGQQLNSALSVSGSGHRRASMSTGGLYTVLRRDLGDLDIGGKLRVYSKE
jgi:hypothetical protein